MASVPITDMAGIRQQLNAMGIGNERIGFDKNSGYVTIDGQAAIRPAKVEAGVSYATPADIRNQLNQFNFNQQLANLQRQTQNYGQQLQNIEQQFLQPQQQTNPYDQQVQSLLQQIQQMTMNQQPIDPYSTPQWAAAQAQAQRGAQQAIRGAQESLGGSGLARSSLVTDRAQNIQNQANEYLQTQVVPQIVQQIQAERQQQLSGLYNLLGALSGQQALADERARAERNQLADMLDYLSGRETQQREYAYRTIRDAVEDMRYDERMAYQRERDRIEDERDKRNFDEDVRRFGLQYALQQQQERRLAANAAADQALARARFEYQKERDRIEDERYERERLAKQQPGLSDEDLRLEASEMIAAIRSGQLTPAQALQQINDDEAVGIYSASNANFLRDQLARVAPTTPATTNNTQSQSVPVDKSDKEIEAEARRLGYPTLDYRSWYKSPNGRAAGIDFATWQRLYGPRIG